MTTAELRAAASKATPGLWKHIPWHIEEGSPAVRSDAGRGHIIATTASDDDARYIDLVQPTAILALLDSHETALASERARADALAAEVERLREVLTPFAEVAEHDIGSNEVDADIFRPMDRYNVASPVKVGDLRRARSLLNRTGEG